MLHKLQMQKFPNKKQTPFWHIEIFALPSFLNRSGGRGAKTMTNENRRGFVTKARIQSKKLNKK
jgi:hypothetical protein